MGVDVANANSTSGVTTAEDVGAVESTAASEEIEQGGGGADAAVLLAAAVVSTGASPCVTLFFCFVGINEEESGSRHFRFPLSFSRADFWGSLGSDLGVFGNPKWMGELVSESPNAEMSDSAPSMASKRR